MQLSLRGIGVPIIVAYLVDLGGVEREPGLVEGPGWRARVWAGEPVQMHALQLGVTEIAFSGEPAAVDRVVAALKKKAIRGGG